MLQYSGCFLLEGCTYRVRAGRCVAGTDVDLFRRAGVGAVVICAVGHVTGNTLVFFTGFAGFFRRIVIHDLLSFQSKKSRKTYRAFVLYCLPESVVLYSLEPDFGNKKVIDRSTFRFCGIFHCRKEAISHAEGIFHRFEKSDFTSILSNSV